MWEIIKMLKKGEAATDNIPKEMAHIEFSPPSELRKMNDGAVSAYVTHFPLWSLPKSSYSQAKSGEYCINLLLFFLLGDLPLST